MTYEMALEQLGRSARFGMDLDLGRMRQALVRLGAPERRLGRVVHVAGTNGKGSTAAMSAAILRAAGLRTGLYTSPHLARVTERIRIDGVEVTPSRFAELFARVRELQLTFFELLTVIAFLQFAEERVDATVLEVGLGGRLDATNVVDAEVAVVTGVALDHEAILGRDVGQIALEKAGIFKPGRIAVVGSGGEPEARPILEAAAHTVGARLIRAGADVRWPVALCGLHQRRNAACAVAVAEALGLPEHAMGAGLAAVAWPGRLETVAGVLLDCAHNPHGARALAEHLRGTRGTAVVAVSSDKDAAALLAPLVPWAERFVVTEAPSSRALPTAVLATLAESLAPGRVEIEPVWQRAVARAERPLVVFGSIFLIGAARALLLGEAVDPILVADPAKVAAPPPAP